MATRTQKVRVYCGKASYVKDDGLVNDDNGTLTAAPGGKLFYTASKDTDGMVKIDLTTVPVNLGRAWS